MAGINGDYQYSGSSKSLDFQLSRTLHRSGSQKTTLTADIMAREQRNYIDDTEIEVQRRQTAAWKLGIQHRHYIGNATLDAGISYQRGTRWFGAQPAPEEYYGYGTALSKILQLNANLNIPFSLGQQRFSFNTLYQRQSGNTPLTSPDMFSIGNRWTVRGFDGERTLSATAGTCVTISPGSRHYPHRNSIWEPITVKWATVAVKPWSVNNLLAGSSACAPAMTCCGYSVIKA